MRMYGKLGKSYPNTYIESTLSSCTDLRILYSEIAVCWIYISLNVGILKSSKNSPNSVGAVRIALDKFHDAPVRFERAVLYCLGFLQLKCGNWNGVNCTRDSHWWSFRDLTSDSPSPADHIVKVFSAIHIIGNVLSDVWQANWTNKICNDNKWINKWLWMRFATHSIYLIISIHAMAHANRTNQYTVVFFVVWPMRYRTLYWFHFVLGELKWLEKIRNYIIERTFCVWKKTTDWEYLHAILKSIGGSAQSIWPAISTQSRSFSVSNSPSRTNNLRRKNVITEHEERSQRMQHTILLNHWRLEHPHNVRLWQSFYRQYKLHRIPKIRFAGLHDDTAIAQPTGNHR